MRHRILGIVGAAALVAGVALGSAAPAGADTWTHGGGAPAPTAKAINLFMAFLLS